jgi:tungstate transport system ATP-binding protein
VPAGSVSLISIRGLTFSYDRAPVVQIDELSLPRERITAVIGPNGCGKTTLFKLINGLLEPDSGQVAIDGTPIASAAGKALLRRHCIYVHQKPYIFRQSVAENVAYGLRVRGVPRERWAQRIDASLQAVGIAHLADRQGRALSGGERQRLAIARGVALQPRLLLLDEPTSNIDPESVRIIEQAAVTARNAGITVILSTHNLATAYRIADDIVRMEAGRTAPDAHNVYNGSYEHNNEATGRFCFSGGCLVTAAIDGSFSAAVVPMDDVILSAGEMASSAQNRFAGVVVGVTPFANGVRVHLDCGFPLSSLVTQAAVSQLRIREGVRLSASFKASAVRLY